MKKYSKYINNPEYEFVPYQQDKLTEYPKAAGTHEASPYGGIPIGKDNLTEGGETEKNNYVYSDRLIVPGKNYSFAEESKKIENKYKFRKHDLISKEDRDRKLNDLTNLQEMLRASKGMGGPTDKMPTTGGSGQFGPAEFKYGGKKKYSGGGSFLEKPKNYSTQEDKPAYWDLRFQAPEQADINEYIPETPVVRNNAQIVPGNYNSIALQEPQVSQPKQKFDWGEAGVLGAQLAGDIVGLFGSKAAKVNYPKVYLPRVSYNQAATDITNNAALLENSAAKSISGIGQSSGDYLNRRANLAARLGQQTGAQLAELRRNEANQNAQIGGAESSQNAEIGRLNVDATQMEKDRAKQYRAYYLSQIGAKTAGFAKDKKQETNDKEHFKTLIKLYPYLFRDKEVLKLMQEQTT